MNECIHIRLIQNYVQYFTKLLDKKAQPNNLFPQKTQFSEVHWFCGKHKCTSVNIQTKVRLDKQWRLLIIDIFMYIPYVRTEDIPTRQN